MRPALPGIYEASEKTFNAFERTTGEFFFLAPTGLRRFFGVTQAKARAMLSWPFGPSTRHWSSRPTARTAKKTWPKL